MNSKVTMMMTRSGFHLLSLETFFWLFLLSLTRQQTADATTAVVASSLPSLNRMSAVPSPIATEMSALQFRTYTTGTSTKDVTSTVEQLFSASLPKKSSHSVVTSSSTDTPPISTVHSVSSTASPRPTRVLSPTASAVRDLSTPPTTNRSIFTVSMIMTSFNSTSNNKFTVSQTANRSTFTVSMIMTSFNSTSTNKFTVSQAAATRLNSTVAVKFNSTVAIKFNSTVSVRAIESTSVLVMPTMETSSTPPTKTVPTIHSFELEDDILLPWVPFLAAAGLILLILLLRIKQFHYWRHHRAKFNLTAGNYLTDIDSAKNQDESWLSSNGKHSTDGIPDAVVSQEASEV